MLDPNSPIVDAISTPALIVDRVALAANIASMADTAAKARIKLRPHAKTHKSPQIAALQRQAGAIGAACATLAEAEGLAKAGIGGLLITSPVVGGNKLRRLLDVHRQSPLTVVVDHPSHVDSLRELVAGEKNAMTLLVDIDLGQRRTGVVAGEDALQLARRIASEPNLQYGGVQAYAGHVQHVVDPTERRVATGAASVLLREAIARLIQNGLAPPVVSGTGTGASEYDAELGLYSEWQVGSYVFMDAEYGQVRRAGGTRLPFANALFVLTTVVSVNRNGFVTVDAGTKAMAVNGPVPDRILGVAENATFSFAGDEHGIIGLPDGAPTPRIGERVLIVPTHCDPTVNLHPVLHAVDPDGGVEQWPVVGRHGQA